jgi:pimeloyl-ACP methyl ester carboxylesterase
VSADRPPAEPRPTGGPGVTRFATRGDHRLSYESIGATDGIPVLGLHDLLADRGQLRALGETLPSDRFRLTLPDARGHGASPMISGRAYPAAELIADALAVFDTEGITRVHIAAIGWATGIALGIALLAPERVASLVLVQPFLPALTGQADVLETLRQAADAAEKGQTDRALDLYLGFRLGASWGDGLPKPRLGAMRRAAGSLAPLLTGMTGSSFDQAALARLDTRMTLLLPAGAPAIERESAVRLTDRLTGSRIETQVLEDADLLQGQDWTPAIARALLAQTAK